jgi:type IV secretory pathway component VirB8
MADQLGQNNVQQKMIGTIQPKTVARADVRRNIARNEDSVVVNASEKRYLWTARAFAVVTAISLCCNLLLLLTISNILPLQRVEPYLVTLSGKEAQVYRIIPYSNNMNAEKSITETFVRQYVLLRTTLLSDIDEMEARWLSGGDLEEMSSPIVYQEFRKNTGDLLLKRMKDEGLTSNVKLITVNEVDEGVWQVEYSVEYRVPSAYELRSKRYRASLRVRYVSRRVKYQERLKNPVGFKVVSYGIKEIKE